MIGVGLSPRGNDNPRASGNVSTSPVKFLQGMGAAYRASGRTKPLMDQFAYHPYPKKDTDGLTEGYEWPNAGITNFDRVKQAFWDAFGRTGQRTFEQGLRVKLDEVGWQVGVVPPALAAYFGAESIVPTSEATQASIYAALLRYASCDPAIDSVLFFGLQDEPNLERWQAGLMRADGSPRPSYGAVKATIAETAGNCVGTMRAWRHSTSVDGARATFPRDRRLPSRVIPWSFLASEDEDALFDAGVLQGDPRSSRRQGPALRVGQPLRTHDALRALPRTKTAPGNLRLLDPLPRRCEREPRNPQDESPVRHLPISVAQTPMSGAWHRSCLEGRCPGARHQDMSVTGKQVVPQRKRPPIRRVPVPGTRTCVAPTGPQTKTKPKTKPCGGSRRRRLAATTLEAVRAPPVRPS